MSAVGSTQIPCPDGVFQKVTFSPVAIHYLDIPEPVMARLNAGPAPRIRSFCAEGGRTTDHTCGHGPPTTGYRNGAEKVTYLFADGRTERFRGNGAENQVGVPCGESFGGLTRFERTLRLSVAQVARLTPRPRRPGRVDECLRRLYSCGCRSWGDTRAMRNLGRDALRGRAAGDWVLYSHGGKGRRGWSRRFAVIPNRIGA